MAHGRQVSTICVEEFVRRSGHRQAALHRAICADRLGKDREGRLWVRQGNRFSVVADPPGLASTVAGRPGDIGSEV